MFKKTSLIFFTLSIILFSSFVFIPKVSANTVLNPWGTDNLHNNIQDTTGLGNKDPREIAASVVKVVLGFLGIIAVLIILYAGFLWMTAAGNDDKISTAKSMLSAGIIGLIIILAAFGLATFVVNTLVNSTTV